MTREEAINILNRDDDSMRKGYFCINDFKAIEVLKSEEPILEKIRAEIEHMACRQYEYKLMLDREDVLKVFNKYGGEA